jgi:hypothetical protein
MSMRRTCLQNISSKKKARRKFRVFSDAMGTTGGVGSSSIFAPGKKKTVYEVAYDHPPHNNVASVRRSTTARGYGSAHQALRKKVAALVASGNAVCWRCGRPILPWMQWDLGHDDFDRSIYRGPEHQRCNRSSAASRGNRMRGKRRQQRTLKVLDDSRVW